MHGVLLRITNLYCIFSMVLSEGQYTVPLVICLSHILLILTDITNVTNRDLSYSGMYLYHRVSGSEPTTAGDEARLTAGISLLVSVAHTLFQKSCPVGHLTS